MTVGPLVHDAKDAEVAGFRVRRALPRRGLRTVGAWCFADHMGPAEVTETAGLDVGPHPHTGLQTVTWLMDGAILHRDSLGSEQLIRPGQVNLMTAGRGIVHSERAGSDFNTTSRLHGIQSWMALPTEQEECEPAFVHIPASEIPMLNESGVQVRIIIGTAYGSTSPVSVHAPMPLASISAALCNAFWA